MKIEFLRDPDAAEIVDPEKFDRLKLVVAWISLSVLVTIFICARNPSRVRVASSKNS